MTLGRAETGGCVPGQLWLVSHILFPFTLSLVKYDLFIVFYPLPNPAPILIILNLVYIG